MKRKERTLAVPFRKAEQIRHLLEHEPANMAECMSEDETVTWTADFGGGYEMDVMVCGVQYDEDESDSLPWTQAVLFRDGSEVVCSEPGDGFFGTWELEADGTVYAVDVVEDFSYAG